MFICILLAGRRYHIGCDEDQSLQIVCYTLKIKNVIGIVRTVIFAKSGNNFKPVGAQSHFDRGPSFLFFFFFFY